MDEHLAQIWIPSFTNTQQFGSPSWDVCGVLGVRRCVDDKGTAVPTEAHHFGSRKLWICVKPFPKLTVLPGMGITSKAEPIIKQDNRAMLHIGREKAESICSRSIYRAQSTHTMAAFRKMRPWSPQTYQRKCRCGSNRIDPSSFSSAL